jgi:hypothetical protein
MKKVVDYKYKETIGTFVVLFDPTQQRLISGLVVCQFTSPI